MKAQDVDNDPIGRIRKLVYGIMRQGALKGQQPASLIQDMKLDLPDTGDKAIVVNQIQVLVNQKIVNACTDILSELDALPGPEPALAIDVTPVPVVLPAPSETTIDLQQWAEERRSLKQCLYDVERAYILHAMRYCRTIKDLSVRLGISRPSAYEKLDRFDIEFSSWAEEEYPTT